MASLLLFSSCGKDQAQANSAGAQPSDETCSGANCTEQSINAPVGVQPNEVVVPYDTNPSNPKRTTLRFPEFDASWGMKQAIFTKAVGYFQSQVASIDNPRYFTIVDFNLNASKPRMFIFDLSNGTVEKHNTAAGSGSDPDGDGFATLFSNVEGSKESSLGFYKTLTTYNGKHGYSLKLAGLSATNSNAEAREIMMHPADYVTDGVRAGRSWGCTAIDPKTSKSVIDKVKNGSIMLVDR
jgi:hypothetical protein